jgi:uncharacterized cofD-like protein
VTAEPATRRAVAIGGGTGLPRVLKALVSLGFDVSAVVAMADDGGSTGVLRAELGAPAVGDIRNCLVALGDGDSPLARVFQHRLRGEGTLAGHAVGNLVMAALADEEGGLPAAIANAGAWLGACGDVFPSTLDDVRLVGFDREGRRIVGQSAVAHSGTAIASVELVPADAVAYAPATEAIRHADVVVVGPGSLYTSVMPNLLLDGVRDALRETRGTCVYMCNVANQRGETTGHDAADHVAALFAHGMEGGIDAVVVHDSDGSPLPAAIEPVESGAAVQERIRAFGVTVVSAPLAEASDQAHHDPAAVARVLTGLLQGGEAA